MLNNSEKGIKRSHAHILESKKITETEYAITWSDDETFSNPFIGYTLNSKIIFDTTTQKFSATSASYDFINKIFGTEYANIQIIVNKIIDTTLAEKINKTEYRNFVDLLSSFPLTWDYRNDLREFKKFFEPEISPIKHTQLNLLLKKILISLKTKTEKNFISNPKNQKDIINQFSVEVINSYARKVIAGDLIQKISGTPKDIQDGL
jgi:hypothetical protein